MDSVLDLSQMLVRLPFLNGTVVAIGVCLTAAIIVIASDRRVLLASMALQYILTGSLFSHVLPWRVAAVKTLAGLFSCLILFVTAWRTGWRPVCLADEVDFDSDIVSYEGGASVRTGYARIPMLAIRVPLRVFAIIMVGLLGLYLYTLYEAASVQAWLPSAPDGVGLAMLQLLCLGLLVTGLTEEPLRAGLGLLTALTGFGIFYSMVEPALAVIGLLAAVQLAVALGTSYLAVLEAHLAGSTNTIPP